MGKSSSNTSARRREVRRAVPKPIPTWGQLLRRREAVWAIAFIAGLTIFGGLIALNARSRMPHYVGQVISQPIVARVSFKAVDEVQTLKNREKARDSEPALYRPNPEFFRRVRDRLDEIILYAADPTVVTIDQLPEQVVKDYKFTQAALQSLRQQIRDGEPSPEWKRNVDLFLEEVTSHALLSSERYEVETDPRAGARKIHIVHPRLGEVARYENQLFNAGNPRDVERFGKDKVGIPADQFFPGPVRQTVIAAVTRDALSTHVFDIETTRQRRDEKFNSPENIEERVYREGEVIADAGDTLSQPLVDHLTAERDAYRRELGVGWHWAQRAGMLGTFLVLSVGLWIYLVAYNDRIARNPMRGLAITALMIFCQLLAVTLTDLGPKYTYFAATLPTIMAAMILAIAYDRRMALAIGAIHAVIVVASLDLTTGFGICLLAGVGVAVCQLDEVRTRSKLLEVGAWTAMAMGFAAVIVGLAERPLHLTDEWKRLLFDAAMAAVSGVAAGLLVQGILPFVERAFKVTTAMTLKELNDASHPLLLQLAQEAPGTYQHSLRIADMAEGAAEAINANGLLCKVGAMYHDIGKMNKPMYFIENQGGGPNRHNKLSPAMSLLIIVGHVKDGIEMAREYGLPQSIRHFIESHHGTTLVEYFYHAARKQKEAEAEPAPNEFEFRYPGPKPQTKEAAIILLCDSVEAAVRAMPEPTPIRIEQRVREIASKRLMDGQFDESNITLAELHKIEQAVVKTLCAIYHGRIRYPEEKRPTEPPRQPEQLPPPRLADDRPEPDVGAA
jgi:putative nucleotidyltransferase with HDIG domain